jgi:NADP-dependent 3-hydroxy acid dehydrogenase YdfG
MEAQGGLFVTVQDTGGDFGLQSDPGARAWLGGLAGLAKTAAQEWPQAVVRAIDLASALPPETVAARLAQELLQGGAELEIGLPLDGRRLGLLSVDTPAVPGAPVVNERSVLVVAGGGRGVTAAALVALAQAAHPHIALLGRTVLEPEPQALAGIHDDAGLKKALLASAQAAGKRLTPKELGAAADRIQAMREIRGTLLALSAAGAQAMYLACDVNDPEATAAALETVRGLWGPITGFVHGAGVLADKRLAEKTPEDFRRVFGAKVDGLRSLLAATAADPLRVICLFSSVAGRTGNAGQADYAMANEVLNRVAQAEAKRRPECVVKSIGWGPWAGGMVTPVLKAKFDELGVPLIPLASGARAFVAELQAPRDQVEVVIGGMPQSRPLLQTGSPDVTAATQRGVAQANRPFVYDVAVSAATHPYLYDHQVNGVVVLPLVLVQEWFLRAAEACLATALPCIVLDKMRVRKGVPLPEFGEYPVRLRVRCEPLPAQQGMWALTLHDAAGVVRFAAEAGVAERAAAGAFMAETISTDMAAAPVMRAGQSLYGRELFHGPAFAAIQSVEEVGELGAAGLIAGASDLHWGQAAAVGAAPWRSDLPLLDGALQLARVWGYTVLQRPTLPTAYARLSVRREGLLAGPLRCVVRGKPIGQAGTRSDLFLLDPRSGELLAEIRGLEMYVSSEAPLPEGER